MFSYFFLPSQKLDNISRFLFILTIYCIILNPAPQKPEKTKKQTTKKQKKKKKKKRKKKERKKKPQKTTYWFYSSKISAAHSLYN